MRILHTSDWHLGQRFLQSERTEEQQLALDHLLSVINREKIDLLLVAGDIFDIGNPPFSARKMYYQFLTSLLGSSCRYVVITGGNHDAPGMLDAPRELLQHLNVFVVGAAPAERKDVLLEMRNTKGQLEAVIAAVPFLRDRDLRFSVAGETGPERIERLRQALAEYFQQLGELAEVYSAENVPILCMGHLYATGAQSSGEQNNIYLADVENIAAGAFPEIFSYVALGHIHRPQVVGGVDRVRYSGSLIPLSFSETKDDKSVYVLEYKGAVCKKITPVPIPVFRRLKTIEGALEEVEQKLTEFAARPREGLRPWVEVIVQTETVMPRLDEELRAFCADMDLDLMKIRVQSSHTSLSAWEQQEELRTLEPLDVFRRRCSAAGRPPEEQEELEQTFVELMTWMTEQENELQS